MATFRLDPFQIVDDAFNAILKDKNKRNVSPLKHGTASARNRNELLVAVLTYHHLIIIIIIIVLATVNKCNCRVRQPFNKQPRDDRGDAAAVLL